MTPTALDTLLTNLATTAAADDLPTPVRMFAALALKDWLEDELTALSGVPEES